MRLLEHGNVVARDEINFDPFLGDGGPTQGLVDFGEIGNIRGAKEIQLSGIRPKGKLAESRHAGVDGVEGGFRKRNSEMPLEPDHGAQIGAVKGFHEPIPVADQGFLEVDHFFWPGNPPDPLAMEDDFLQEP